MIGLVMLVRDEAEMLPQTLPSILPIVDHAVIIDTGSTDNTIAVATEMLEEHLPARWVIDEMEWAGFAETRTKAFREAAGFFGGPDRHWLFLDADMKLEVDWPLPELDRDAYYLTLPGPFRMSLPLLLRDGLPWRWEGAAHSYLVWPDNCTSAELPNIRVYEQRKNSPREEKIKDDLKALEAELDPRTVFYFAQTLKDLGHPREAADAYRFRIRLSSSAPQDVFWACYQEGILRLETEGLERATPVLLEAYHRRPTRAESLCVLAREYRLAGMPRVAAMFAEQAAWMEMPDDRGFVLAWVYDWGAKMELALAYRAIDELREALALFQVIAGASCDTSEEAQKFAEAQIQELNERLRPELVAGSPA